MVKGFNKKHAALIFVITFLVYSPVLFNQYVEDDYNIIANNTFYHSWQNIPRVLGEGYLADTRARVFDGGSKIDLGTAKAAYRPVSNLTYFLDFYLFQDNPWGSHLINILIHGINAVLVCGVVNQVFSSSVLGVFAGLLFSLHPIETEAVSVAGFHADLLAAMFTLFSFYFWMRFGQSGYNGKKYYFGSLATCFLALLSKESAFTLPLVILLFDQAFMAPPPHLKPRSIYCSGLIFIYAFYLYLYFIVFPNAYHPFYFLGGNLTNHCLSMGYIWFNYLKNLLMPWTVGMIPSQYVPPVPRLFSVMTAEIGSAFIVFLTSVYLCWRHYKKARFFLLWYIVFYLPLSDLVPVVNPMAYRYMYLPSMGLLIVLAGLLHDAFKSDFLKKYSRNLSGILHGAVIMVCVTRTLFLNSDWKNGFDIGYAWVRDYPAFHQGYAIIGGEYFARNDFKKAQKYLEKSLRLGGLMPGEFRMLAECYLKLGKTDAAETVLKETAFYYPDFDIPYLYLGEIYIHRHLDHQTQEMLEKSLAINPKRPLTYRLLMKIYLESNEQGPAKNLLDKAGLYLNAQNASALRPIRGE